jgi:hypothetical protein
VANHDKVSAEIMLSKELRMFIIISKKIRYMKIDKKICNDKEEGQKKTYTRGALLRGGVYPWMFLPWSRDALS